MPHMSKTGPASLRRLTAAQCRGSDKDQPGPHAIVRAGEAHIAEQDALGLGDVLLDACISLNSHLRTSHTAGAPANGLKRPGLLWRATRSRGASQVCASPGSCPHIQSCSTQSSRNIVIESRWQAGLT